MIEKFKKLLAEKARHGKSLPDNEKIAKMSAVREMGDMASHMMGDKLHGLKKVSVASSSKEGLKEGLDKAKELVNSSNHNPDEESMGEGESPIEDMAEDSDLESHPSEDKSASDEILGDESPEEVSEKAEAESQDEKISRLEKEIEALKSKIKG